MTFPERFSDAEHLEDVMSTPSAALMADLARVPGDIMVLGVGGKMGPTLARMAKRAAQGRRVIGVARFSEAGLRERLAAHGVEVHRRRPALARGARGAARGAQHRVHGRAQVRLAAAASGSPGR
jgi:hypothetical protein